MSLYRPNIIKHLSYDYLETSMVQRHRDLNRSFDGLPTHLASRWQIVIDVLVVNTKDFSIIAKVLCLLRTQFLFFFPDKCVDDQKYFSSTAAVPQKF